MAFQAICTDCDYHGKIFDTGVTDTDEVTDWDQAEAEAFEHVLQTQQKMPDGHTALHSCYAVEVASIGERLMPPRVEWH